MVVRSGGSTREQSLYFAAKFLAQAAQNLLLATLFIAAGTSSSAAIDLSSLFVAILIPALVLGPLGGATVDKLGPARAYPIGAALRLGTVLAALFLLGGGERAWVIAFAYSAVSQVYSPSEIALIRTLQPNRSSRAHSFSIAIQYAGQGAGMLVLAPALYFWGGSEMMLLGAALGFAGVTLFAALLGQLLRSTDAAIELPARQAYCFGETCRFFIRERRAGYAVVTLAFKTIVSRAIVIALPFYMQRDMGLGEESLVFLLIPGIVGIGVGLIWSHRSLTLDSAYNAMRFSLAGMIVAVFAFAALDYGVTAMAQYSQVPPIAELEASMNTTFAVALPVAFLLGIVLTTSLTAARVTLTETAPDGQQARVFAVEETLTEAMVVAPLLLTGIGTEYAGARSILVVIGVIAATAFLLMELPRFRVPKAVRAAIAPAASESAS
ncbi:MAG: MFS transporter [Hyphomicrobiales bacterium]